MTQKETDHAYHRSRVDAHISGNIVFLAVLAVMALIIGDRFEPFNAGAKWLEPVRLVWLEDDQAWVAEHSLRQPGLSDPRSGQAEKVGPVSRAPADQPGSEPVPGERAVLPPNERVAVQPSVPQVHLVTREIYPISHSIILVVGSLAAALFIYRCAHRQAGLMIALFGTGPDAPYQRPWREIRVTFWALDIATLFVLFFFLS